MKDVEHIKHFDMSDSVKRASNRWLHEAGVTVSGSAKQFLVKGHGLKTGNLKRSIDYKVTDDECSVGTNVEYAPYVEYGTARWPTGAAFLRPALRQEKPRLMKRWKALMKEAQRA